MKRLFVSRRAFCLRRPAAAWCAALLTAAALGVVQPARISADEKETLNDLQTLLRARRNYVVPEGGVQELAAFLKSVKLNRPRTDDEFFQMQRAIRTAADKILTLEADPKSPVRLAALQDSLFAGARLIGQAPESEQQTELKRIESYLETAELDRIDYAIAKTAAQELERAGATATAARAYESFGKRFAGGADPQVRASAKLLQGAARRMTIVGQPLELAGNRVDGRPFDLKSLEGKVVLVEFWATWCQKCREEFPAFKKVHEAYAARGFEVVGVSVDEDRDELEKYLRDQHVPWITLHEKEADGNHPALERYGIFSFPSTFLIGKDGKVLATRVTGESLEGLVEAALK